MTRTLLALETSGTRCGVALWRDEPAGASVSVASHDGTQGHAERLLPMVSGLLDAAGLTPADLDVVAFGQGPGAFTGLRVACGVAQGMALALDIPLVAIGAHEAVADDVLRAATPAIVAVAMDARMGESYVAVFALDAQADHKTPPRTIQAPLLLGASDLPGWLAQGRQAWLDASAPGTQTWLAGDAWLAYAEQIVVPMDWQIMPVLRPAAAAVARLGALAWARGQTIDAADASPLYVRDKVAFTTAERAAGQGGNPKAAAQPGNGGPA